MDLNPAVMYRSRGIPAGNRRKASALTLAGYAANLERYDRGITDSVAAAIAGVKAALDNSASRTLPLGANPYGQVLGSPMFIPPAGLSGLGDAQTPGGSSSWFDVLKTVGANVSSGIGLGIASKLGYRQPGTTVVQAPPSKVPGWVVPAALAGGAGVLFLLLRRR